MGSPAQLNVEYFFRLLYDCLHGACYGSANFSGFDAFIAGLWIWITVIGYLLSFLGLVLIIYCLIRLFELRHHEEEELGTLLMAAHEAPVSPRWAHIEQLMASDSESDWRQAVIEADIMLGDVLARAGYTGGSVGDQLHQVDPKRLGSLRDAWQAHEVRNRIAHDGSNFDLSQLLVHRTLGRYEMVFRELKAL